MRWTINLSSTEPAEPSAELSLTPGVVLIEEWGRGARVQVQGRSNLPDGADVLCNLEFDGFKVLATFSSSEVRDGVWTVILYAPKTSHIYSGRYEVVPIFNSLLAPDKVEKWRQSAPAGTWDQTREVTGGRSIFVGDPAEALEEDRAVEVYYQRLLVDARRFHQGLESRIREILDDGKGWDPALLRAREEARTGWFRESFVDAEGNLRVDRWREFLDGRWRPAVRLLREEHRARPDKKYIEAENRLEELLTALLQMSQVYSLFFVYPLFHVPSHPNDYYVDEREGKDLGLLQKIVDEDLRYLQRFCYLVPE